MMYLLLVAAAAAHVYRRERHNQMIMYTLAAQRCCRLKNEVETNHVLFKNTMKNDNPEHLSPLGPTLLNFQGLKVGFSCYEDILFVTLLFWASRDIDYSTVTARKAHRDIDDKKPCTRKHRVQLMSVHNTIPVAVSRCRLRELEKPHSKTPKLARRLYFTNNSAARPSHNCHTRDTRKAPYIYILDAAELDATRPSRPRPTRGTTACSWCCRAEISWMTRVSSVAAAAAAAATRMTTKFPASGTPSNSNSTAVRSRISYRGCKYGRIAAFKYIVFQVNESDHEQDTSRDGRDSGCPAGVESPASTATRIVFGSGIVARSSSRMGPSTRGRQHHLHDQDSRQSHGDHQRDDPTPTATNSGMVYRIRVVDVKPLESAAAPAVPADSDEAEEQRPAVAPSSFDEDNNKKEENEDSEDDLDQQQSKKDRESTTAATQQQQFDVRDREELTTQSHRSAEAIDEFDNEIPKNQFETVAL
ncbi:unnamed protein product [Trichogramma brassicae]|uniref:Uncharacterized protein n=1 Tax=Trichogramma brassicae TaxID=86971 RepID=A0A6H5J9N9_9HYME|nr:unnamed protein product [Trichogramma brassicae]